MFRHDHVWVWAEVVDAPAGYPVGERFQVCAICLELRLNRYQPHPFRGDDKQCALCGLRQRGKGTMHP